MFITTLNLSNPTDKIEILNGQTIKITSQKQQTIKLDEVEVKSRFFINPKGFANDIILLELHPNGLWYNINRNLERNQNYTHFSETDLEFHLSKGNLREIKNCF